MTKVGKPAAAAAAVAENSKAMEMKEIVAQWKKSHTIGGDGIPLLPPQFSTLPTDTLCGWGRKKSNNSNINTN